MPDLTQWSEERRNIRVTPEGKPGQFILDEYADGQRPAEIRLEQKQRRRFLLDISVTPIRNGLCPGDKLVEIHFCRQADKFGDERIKKITPREKEVFRLMLLGATNKSAAHYLGITEGTVKKLLSNCYRKLGVNSRSEAMIKYYSYEV